MGRNAGGAGDGNAIYGLGMFGAWAWFFQQAEDGPGCTLAVVQGIFWPAFLVYEVFKRLADDA